MVLLGRGRVCGPWHLLLIRACVQAFKQFDVLPRQPGLLQQGAPSLLYGRAQGSGPDVLYERNSRRTADWYGICQRPDGSGINVSCLYFPVDGTLRPSQHLGSQPTKIRSNRI